MQVAVPYGAVLLLTTWCYLVIVLKPRDIERIPEIVYHTVGGARTQVLVSRMRYRTRATSASASWCWP